MVFQAPLIVTADMEKSVRFYKEVLGLDVIMDFGANKTLRGGIVLQTEETFREFLGRPITFGGNDAELYFEEDDFDAFAEALRGSGAEYVHPVKEHAWGQRVVRFCDPDGHIIEVGENMKSVCRRFYDSGMTREQVALRMDVPTDYVDACLE